MPQDGSRSVAYRSFFSCDDPKGVVECKTNRKSKTDSHKLEGGKVEHQKKQKNLSKSFSFKEERKDLFSEGMTDHELHNSSSYQLMEVSKGSQKLNKVVDSLPLENSFDKQSKDIAEDLLRGALDLKESLTMLGKLQEASQIMAKLKKKHKEKARGRDLERTGIERTTSERFGYYDHKMLEFQNPRLSVDGSSRDCFEELREVIRESFARQNLLPKTSNEVKAYSATKTSNEEKAYSEDKVYFDRTKYDLSLDLPSTSSSQSSIFHSHEFDTSSDFSLSKSIEEKPKATNVIAKLMGLEEIPQKPFQSTPQKFTEKETALSHGKMSFDIDLPTVRRPHNAVQKVDSQTVDKLTDNRQFKGLATSKSVDRTEHLSNASDWKKRFAYDAPPIVIIKPFHVSGSLEEELLGQKYIHQDLDTKKILRKCNLKEGLPPRPKYDQEGTLNFYEAHTKLRAEKDSVKRRIQEQGDNDIGDAMAKKDDKSVKRQENLSATAVQASAPAKPKLQKKELTDKTVPKIQRVVANTRKQVEAGSEKFKDSSKSRQTNKLASTNPKKPVKESNASKVRVLREKASTSECTTLATSQNSSVRKKNVRNEKRISEPSTIIVERKSKNDNIPVELGCDNEQVLTAKGIMPSEQLPSDEKKYTSGNLDYGNNSRSSLCESTNLIQPKIDIRSIHDDVCSLKTNLTQMKICKRSNSTMNLLLDSSSFLIHAQELFDIHACQPVMSHMTSSHDPETADTKLLLECAKELLEHKSFQCRVAVNPLSRIHIKKSKICISLDQLVNEICDGIEYLRSYRKLAGTTVVVDTLSKVIQKDMWCKGLVNGACDFGWRNGFTLVEIDQVVLDIEQKILNGIIEDMLMEMTI